MDQARIDVVIEKLHKIGYENAKWDEKKEEFVFDNRKPAPFYYRKAHIVYNKEKRQFVVHVPDSTYGVSDMSLFLTDAKNQWMYAGELNSVLHDSFLTREKFCYITGKKMNVYEALDVYDKLLTNEEMYNTVIRGYGLEDVNISDETYLLHNGKVVLSREAILALSKVTGAYKKLEL